MMIRNILFILIGLLIQSEVAAQTKLSFEKALYDLESQNDSVCYVSDKNALMYLKEKALINVASIEQLDSLALNAKIPAIRALAYTELLHRDANMCMKLLPSLVKDDGVLYLDNNKKIHILKEYITRYSALYADLFDSKSIEILDSMVLVHNLQPVGYNEGMMKRCSGNPKFYDIFCDLYKRGNCDVLYEIAVYRNPNDLQTIANVLNDSPSEKIVVDDDDDIDEEGNLNCGLAAVLAWPHQSFVPLLEEIGKRIKGKKGIYGQRGSLFFASIMSYDNEWAYNYIECFFKDKKMREKYSHALADAYTNFGKKPRFLPLVKKYNKGIDFSDSDGPYD